MRYADRHHARNARHETEILRHDPGAVVVLEALNRPLRSARPRWAVSLAGVLMLLSEAFFERWGAARRLSVLPEGPGWELVLAAAALGPALIGACLAAAAALNLSGDPIWSAGVAERGFPHGLLEDDRKSGVHP